MAFNFLNGVEVGLESSSSNGWSFGVQHAKRLIYLWLKKVVGWTEIDIKGNGVWGSAALWDAPITSPRTDGATDATNVRKFTAAGATFISDGVARGDVVLIRPNAAPVTAGGFSDATRNGFYMVNSVVSETELRVHAWFGVHTDGLPLNESGLNFEIHRFHEAARMPIDEDQWVLEGTGVGGTFHLNCRNDRNVNYGGAWLWEISPWPDWIAGATHAWNGAPSRHTTSTSFTLTASTNDICRIWGFADLTQVFIVFQCFNAAGVQQEGGILYVGDINPFHLASDPRPVVCCYGKNNLYDVWNVIQNSGGGVQQIGADNLTHKAAMLSGFVVNQNNTQRLLDDSIYRNRSWYSGRWIRMPMLVTEEETGYEELRGQLKSIWVTHEYGPQLMTPVGASLEWLRSGNLLMPWNGSKQFRYIA